MCLGWRAPLSVVMPLRARAAGRGLQGEALRPRACRWVARRCSSPMRPSCCSEAWQKHPKEHAASQRLNPALSSRTVPSAPCQPCWLTAATRVPDVAHSRASLLDFFLPTLAPPAPPGPPSTSSVKCVTRLDEAGPAMINTM